VINGSTATTFLTTAAVVTVLMVLCLAGWQYQVQRSQDIAQQHQIRLMESRGVIAHLDEVLTNSARLAAVTGEPQWEPRYRHFEPLLDAAIKEAHELLSHTAGSDAAVQTGAANARLVEMERRAFDLVRLNRSTEARTLLFSDEYKQHKRVYSNGITHVTADMKSAASASLRSSRMHGLKSVLLQIAVALMLSLGWGLVLFRLKRGQTALAVAKRKLMRESGERSRLEKELESTRRLESIGQLAAGVAHEINTPAQYVGDNTRFLEESFRELAPLLKKADELAESVRQGTGSSELADELKAALEEADVEYLGEEIPRAIEQSLNGIARVRKIVQSMKEFSHPGVEGMVSVDLNRAIESTITVATNEWKYLAEVETDFDPELPAVSCLPGEINQVVLNLIVNAAHAIADVVGDCEGGKGTITISTRRDGEFVEVRIADTGSGIPETAQSKIFDPFFTTKGVGKGTGQGLSIAHGVVVKKHGGTLDFETEIGKGTTFIIRLPLQRPGVEEPVV
jgi:signal transduction histidine kinase